MTVEDIIAYYYDEVEESAEYDAYAETLYQEAQRISMELNNKYHTPEEIREIMSRRDKGCAALYGRRRRACKDNQKY